MQPKLMARLDVLRSIALIGRTFVARNLSNNRQISIKRTALQIDRTVAFLFTSLRALIKCLYTF